MHLTPVMGLMVEQAGNRNRTRLFHALRLPCRIICKLPFNRILIKRRRPLFKPCIQLASQSLERLPIRRFPQPGRKRLMRPLIAAKPLKPQRIPQYLWVKVAAIDPKNAARFLQRC